MRNDRPKSPYGVIAVFTIFTLLFLGVASPSYTLAEEPGSTPYVKADGDGIIEPGENAQEELARAAQNPVASMISLPFQNNTNFKFGPQEKTQNILNIQPVWPFALNDKWNLITRTIVPVVSQPETAPGHRSGFRYWRHDIYRIFFTKKLREIDLGGWAGAPDTHQYR